MNWSYRMISIGHLFEVKTDTKEELKKERERKRLFQGGLAGATLGSLAVMALKKHRGFSGGRNVLTGLSAGKALGMSAAALKNYLDRKKAEKEKNKKK